MKKLLTVATLVITALTVSGCGSLDRDDNVFYAEGCKPSGVYTSGRYPDEYWGCPDGNYYTDWYFMPKFRKTREDLLNVRRELRQARISNKFNQQGNPTPF